MLLPALLVACDGGVSNDADSTPADDPALPDADSDGWPEEADCDDNNPAIYPGALAPACDTTDYNCDAQPDAVDADADGWLDCAECDDGNASASPDLVEVCEDLADNDCDGTSNDCRLLGDFALRDATAILTSWALGDGGAIAGAGDIDGDGVGDFVVGGWQASRVGIDSEGAAFVVRGGESFPEDLDDVWAVIDGTVPYAYFGGDVQGGTDLSGDGRPDILAGGVGVISVFTALVAGRTTVEERSSAVGDGGNYYATLKNSGPAAGDVTGDGSADLVFWGYESEVASLDIVSGPVASDVGTGDWSARVVNDLTNTNCDSLDGSGDLNGDGIADIAVGCGALDGDEEGDEGGGFVMLGPLSGGYVVSTDADATFVGEVPRGFVGRELAVVGDLNADGFGDLAVSGRRDGTTSGVYVLSGPLSGRVDLANADAYITGESLGSCIASAGDIDRDGRSDLLLGDSGAWLQYGPVSGRLTLAEADTVWSGDEDFYGGDGCAGSGDITGDGGDDLLVMSGSYYSDTIGQVYVLEGVGL